MNEHVLLQVLVSIAALEYLPAYGAHSVVPGHGVGSRYGRPVGC